MSAINSFKIDYSLYKQYDAKINKEGEKGWKAERPVTVHANYGIEINAPIDVVFDPFTDFLWEDRVLGGCAILPQEQAGPGIGGMLVLGGPREIGAVRHILFPNGCVLPETLVAMDTRGYFVQWDSAAIYGGPGSPFALADNDWKYHFSDYLANLKLRDIGDGRTFVEFNGQATTEIESRDALKESLTGIYKFFLTNLKARMESPQRAGHPAACPVVRGEEGSTTNNFYLKSKAAGKS